ncbi:MAG TPA: DUF3943 domain-containing protein [Steroidobacteraceae bacterium]|nr:DUF3943 domain-containing protein [Steroidobacteraceae bacterium]
MIRAYWRAWLGLAAIAMAGTPPCEAADAEPQTTPAKVAPTAFDAPPPLPVLQWGTGDARSFLVPAYEIPAFQLLLNRYDHYAIDAATYPSPLTNISANWHRNWVVDNDKFSTNQFLHPYQGSIYQGLARSAGLTFWEASAYTFAGSLLWEESGENTAPSINDQIATGIGGNFLGEPLFRIASLLLESSNGTGHWWHELGAAIISPATGFNRLVYGHRFDPVFQSHDPAVFTRVDLSGDLQSHFSSNINFNADPTAPPASQRFKRAGATASFTMAYGLPGKPGYTYDRPFDYFNLELTGDTTNGVESVFSRGLLYGADYQVGAAYRGIWGAYGLYDYAAPNIFRVSNVAGAIGTTGQWWLSDSIALHGTALGGVGYAAGGVIHGSGVTRSSPLGEGQRNYHYGIAPESVLALRLVMGDRAALDATARGYYISRLAATESTGAETISRFDVALTVRVFDLHGITLRYERSQRDGHYSDLPSSRQTVDMLSLGYTLLGHQRFGAVDWRRPADEM